MSTGQGARLEASCAGSAHGPGNMGQASLARQRAASLHQRDPHRKAKRALLHGTARGLPRTNLIDRPSRIGYGWKVHYWQGASREQHSYRSARAGKGSEI